MKLAALRKDIRRLATPARRATNLRYFKTGPGEYGEGDRFVGLTVPQMRDVMKRHPELDDAGIAALIRSPIHEERGIGLGFLVERYRKGDPAERERRFRQYVAAFPYINNWDLVDGTAEHVVGPHLETRNKAALWIWARSGRLWDRRIAMLSTFCWIKKGSFSESLQLIRHFLKDPEDLMHKACGWMLREIGKRDGAALRRFLEAHSTRMPRTMLRYAIERFPERERRGWLRRPE